MARILRASPPARARSSLVRAIGAALSDLNSGAVPEDSRDRLGFAVLALRELERLIEQTAGAWEHRGYWLKADRFRREWAWAGQGAAAIGAPLLDGDLPSAQAAARSLLPALGPSADTGSRDLGRDPWKGAFQRLRDDARHTGPR